MTASRQEGPSNGPSRFATFIVRISYDSAGRITGVVEWVRTGEKVRFNGLKGISQVIARMAERATGDYEPP
jgi:hypothetical protein